MPASQNGARVAIVTGASQGIGSGLAARLARDGWSLALLARRAELLASVGASLERDGLRVQCYACDVADASAVERTVERVRSDFDRVDALVNNAGITRDALLVRMKAEQWREVLAVNLDGAYHCIRAVAPLMMRARSGRIVNITSVVGQTGNAGQANYAASKAGLIGLTLATALELAGRGVTVNAVAPGFIETDMTKDLPAGAAEQMRSKIPLGRLGTVEDVAHAVAFLLSDEASYITGQVINVDGGMVMG
jgi:3-oxoacyl-[acyl-carrier protein] reductase